MLHKVGSIAKQASLPSPATSQTLTNFSSTGATSPLLQTLRETRGVGPKTSGIFPLFAPLDAFAARVSLARARCGASQHAMSVLCFAKHELHQTACRVFMLALAIANVTGTLLVLHRL